MSDEIRSDAGQRLGEFIHVAQSLLTRAERLARDQSLLAEASIELAKSSLDYAATLQKVARLVVASFAEWCFVEIVEHGRVRDMAVAHLDAEKEEVARELLRALPQLPNAPHGVARVLRTREAEMHSGGDTPSPLGSYLGVDFPEALRDLGAHSYICAPLVARETAIGAITYVRGPGASNYTSDDLDVARDLARRAAAALDAALLHQRVTEAVQERDELMAMIAHDLRVPLSAISLSTAELLREPLPSPAAERLERIRRTAMRMNLLIEDVLAVATIEHGALKPNAQTRDVEAIVVDVVDMVGGRAREKGVRLSIRNPPGLSVRCDPSQTLRALTNLVDNAIKFTPAGGDVVVSSALDGDYVRISVADSGPGISEDEAPHLFDRFWQGRRQRRGGAGLGLAIAKGIVEAHGGRLWAESPPGKGASFHLTLPRGDATVSTPPGVQSSARDATILLADDDDDFRGAVRDALVAQGFAVVDTGDGQRALETLAAAAGGGAPVPDLVVLDVRMPGCSGLGVLSAMRRLPRSPRTILVTGFRDPSIQVVAERLGAARVLFKPVDLEELLSAVRETLGAPAH
jgi:signal transduction histidine kinase/ActR/RegA family two-component response regulator